MTPEQIEQMKADREAGTDGPWDANATGPQDGWNGWEIHGGGECIATSAGAQNKPLRQANARRIARVPDLEAAYIAQAERIAELEEKVERLELKSGMAIQKLADAEDRIAELETALTTARDDALKEVANHVVDQTKRTLNGLDEVDAEICSDTILALMTGETE